jgi:hypothetical protein
MVMDDTSVGVTDKVDVVSVESVLGLYPFRGGLVVSRGCGSDANGVSNEAAGGRDEVTMACPR